MSFGQVVTSVWETHCLQAAGSRERHSGIWAVCHAGWAGGSPPPALLTYTSPILSGNMPSKAPLLFLHNNCGPCNIVLANEVEVEITVWFFLNKRR